MKKILIVLIVSITCMPWSVPIVLITPSYADFLDVPPTHPQVEAINYVQEQGIVSGYPDGSFKPDNTINRAEFTKILVEATTDDLSIDNCLKSKPALFSDVNKNQWFAKYVCTAKTQGTIIGYPDGTFGPTKEINFAEASKIIINSFGFTAEAADGGQWYEAYINMLKSIDAVPSSLISPDQAVTRAEMAGIIYRVQTVMELNENPPRTVRKRCVTSLEQKKVMELTNLERSKEGLSPLSYNCYLQSSAQAHSEDMQARNFFAHETPEGTTPEERIKASGYIQTYFDCFCAKSYTVGENLAKGQEIPSEVIETWMNSPEHRTNILNPNFSEIGVGITPVGENSDNFVGFIWTQNFGDINLEDP